MVSLPRLFSATQTIYVKRRYLSLEKVGGVNWLKILSR
ncbi:hypothetical protein GACE_1002 [Geoglobus acetivorans]|uniref:Uncharacterized protein n=1 Tax=Geoglobus acetivorans TaxID=565033 RepID=A0A0A7GGH8_GEOAI|nr:hypothetical protein GACE_1002 [Geoglobus acetivorans]